MAAGTSAILDPGPAATPAAAIQTVKAYLRQIPNSYGVLRYVCQDAEIVRQIRALPTPDILFNYLGQFNHVLSQAAPFRRAPESHGRTHNEQGVRERLLEVIGSVVGGQLQINWRYSEAFHHRATIQQVADNYLAALRWLVEPDQPPLAVI